VTFIHDDVSMYELVYHTPLLTLSLLPCSSNNQYLTMQDIILIYNMGYFNIFHALTFPLSSASNPLIQSYSLSHYIYVCTYTYIYIYIHTQNHYFYEDGLCGGFCAFLILRKLCSKRIYNRS
jgi:hypothetical protein